MFQGLFKRAELQIDSVVSKIVSRVLSAVPLVIAVGFATAAATVKLVELYGAVTAFALMAALFAVIGAILMATTGAEKGSATTEEPATQASATAEGSGTGSPDIGDLFTPEMRSLFTSAAPVALPPVLRGVGKNLPLILILALVAFVISRFVESSEELDTAKAPDPSVAVPPAAA